MSARVKLGRIWMVPIQGTYSLAALVLLVAGMATWQFRSIVHGYSAAAYVSAGLFSAVLFIWTVFAHEAAHVAAARHYGAHVSGVTLSLLGGQTAISGQPATPRQGIVVATSGPGVSALCGVACGGSAFATAKMQLPALVPLSFAWVGFLSILLAVANMIPAAPLDGGHVLQAVAWAATGNRVRASAVSGYAGQIVGGAMAAWATWLAVYDRSLLAASMTAIVAWPLWRGASATRRAARQRRLLGGLKVSELMQADIVQLPAHEKLAETAGRLAGRGEGYVAVVDDTGRPRSILSVTRLLAAAQKNPERPVSHVMRRRHTTLVTATAVEPVADVLERTFAKPKAVLVVVNDRVRGLLDPDQIRRALRRAALSHQSTPMFADADAWPGAAR